VKFFKRNRLQSLAIFSQLDWKQKLIANKLTSVELKRPTPHSSGSSDDDGRVKSGSTKLKPIDLEVAMGVDQVQKRLKLFQDISQGQNQRVSTAKSLGSLNNIING